MSISHHKFEILFVKWKEQTINADEYERFNECLLHDTDCQELFLQMQLNDHLLEKAYNTVREVDVSRRVDCSTCNRYLYGVPTRWLVSAAVILLLGFFSVAYFIHFSPLDNNGIEPNFITSGHANGQAENNTQYLARIVRSTNVQWIANGSAEWDYLSEGDRIQFKTGAAEIVFDVGVHLVVEGPAEIDLIDPKRIKVSQGRIAARVSPSGIGFVIETPAGEVIDRGTEFGLDVSSRGEAKVVVYRGKVEVYHQTDTENSASLPMQNMPMSLGTGEGMRFYKNELPKPVKVIEADYFLPAAISRSTVRASQFSVIASVRDNIRDGQSKKFYEIVPQGFGDDAPAFVDRLHEWNGVTPEGLPKFLVGGDMIRTFNEDKLLDDFEMTVTTSAPARFFVLFDKRSQVPDWLHRDFTKTESIVGLDEGVFPHLYDLRYDKLSLITPEERIPDNLLPLDLIGIGPGKSVDFVFDVWERKSTEPGEIVLGGLLHHTSITGIRNTQCFYGIVVVPLHFTRPRAL